MTRSRLAQSAPDWISASTGSIRRPLMAWDIRKPWWAAPLEAYALAPTCLRSAAWDDAGTISHNLLAASIHRECEASLKRLGIDAIDLYQIHWPAWKGALESTSP